MSYFEQGFVYRADSDRSTFSWSEINCSKRFGDWLREHGIDSGKNLDDVLGALEAEGEVRVLSRRVTGPSLQSTRAFSSTNKIQHRVESARKGLPLLLDELAKLGSAGKLEYCVGSEQDGVFNLCSVRVTKQATLSWSLLFYNVDVSWEETSYSFVPCD
jgi:hypothetical protein